MSPKSLFYLIVIFAHSSAWIGALAVGLSYFAAPAVGRMSDCFGCRVMTICGSLLCALSLFATSFAKSISHVFLSYGLLFGLGAACVRTCTFLVAVKHFNRRRSMATGLVSSGTGLGICSCDNRLCCYRPRRLCASNTFGKYSIAVLLYS